MRGSHARAQEAAEAGAGAGQAEQLLRGARISNYL